jgi:proteic killer suppression protein
LDILFNDTKLANICNDPKTRLKSYGRQRAKLLKRRLDDLRAAVVLDDMRNLPGKCHELKGDRKGQLAMKLDGPYVLIFEPANYPKLRKSGEKLDWTKVNAITIIEIVDYHE